MPNVSDEVKEIIQELMKQIMTIVHTEVDQETGYNQREKNFAWYMIMTQIAAWMISTAISVVQEAEEGE